MMNTPLVLKIKHNSLDDGPGIRSVVFMKGCPLDCVWCHNPESKSPAPEIAFDAGKCVACDSCLKVCPEGALSRDLPFFINREKCSLCYQCVGACPSGALETVGQSQAIDDIVGAVLPDKPFFDTSGGGVTLSGGEPTQYMQFTGKLLQTIKQAGIHTLLETCGLFAMDRFERLLYPHLDMIFYDLKLVNESDHQRFCSASNAPILENFRVLSKRHRGGGRPGRSADAFDPGDHRQRYKYICADCVFK